MKHSTVFLLALALTVLPCLVASAQENSPDKTPPPILLPADYKDDEVLPDSTSPDGRYGLVYPKVELSADVEHARLLLVELKPFRVVSEVSPEIRLQHGHNGYSVYWAKDSSAVLVKADRKWGPEKALLVPVLNGQAGKIVDLVPKVENLVRPDYKKSKAVAFNNEGINFILESSYYAVPVKGQPGEDIEENILCFCTSDPKDLHEPSWAVRFEGTWDIAQGKFVRHRITRLPSGTRKNADGL